MWRWDLCQALADMGVPCIVGVDFSQSNLDGAVENCKDYKNIYFKHGNAFDTLLEENRYDLVLARALIHHLRNIEFCFKEAHRILKHGGVYFVQDRTPEDCSLPGDLEHIRGYIFERFPSLLEKEKVRRHKSEIVKESLISVGFTEIKEVRLWETRQVYETKDQLLQDLRERTGRSILHELSDRELNELIDFMDRIITVEGPIVEKDRWTIWKAVK